MIVCINREVLPGIPIAPERPTVRRNPFDNVDFLSLIIFAKTPAVPVTVAVDAHRDPPFPVQTFADFDGCLVELHAVGAGLSLLDLQHLVAVGLPSQWRSTNTLPGFSPCSQGWLVSVWARMDGATVTDRSADTDDGRDEETFAAEMEAWMSFAGESRHLAPSAERVHQEVLQRAGCAGSVVFLWAPAVRGETIAHPGRRRDAPGRIQFKPIGLPDYAESSAWTRGFPGSQASWERGLPGSSPLENP